MAEPAQSEDGDPASLLAVKEEEEHSLEKALAAAFEFTMATAPFSPKKGEQSMAPQPQMAAPMASMSPSTPSTKRRLESDPEGEPMAKDDPQPKRVKTEHDQNGSQGQGGVETLLQDSMDALFENMANYLPQSIEGTGDSLDQHTPQPQNHTPLLPRQTSERESGRNSNRSVSSSVERENDRVLAHLYSDLEEHMRIANMPVIASLATQILLMLRTQCATGNLKDLGDEQADLAAGYKKIKTLFDSSKTIFTDDGTWLWEDELDATDPGFVATVRLVNLATLISMLIVEDHPALPDVHEFFFDIVVPDGGELTQPAADLFLAIKCKYIIKALRDIAAAPAEDTGPDPKSRSDQMAEIMFGELEAKMHQRHADPDGQLPSTDTAFLALAQTRKENLYREIGEEDNLDYLRIKLEDYHEALLEAVAAYLKARASSLLDEASRCGVTLPVPEPETEEEAQSGDLNGGFPLPDGGFAEADNTVQDTLLNLVRDLNAHQQTEQEPRVSTEDVDMSDADDLEGLEALVDRVTQDYVQNRLSQLTPATAWSGAPLAAAGTPSALLSHPNGVAAGVAAAVRAHSRQPLPNGGADGVSLPPNQTVPTTVLYEKARQAAITKSTTSTRREGANGSARRPWSPEEEKALMMGLDIVKGPHWSQILGLFGPNGSQSDILKDRSQVQLKDKARNLKLFFLKTNSEVPYYLQTVTGELKTRAPTQAARKEAEEKAREGQAKFDGTMALDSLRHHPAHGHGQPNGHRQHAPRIAATPAQAAPAPIAAAQPNQNHAHAHASRSEYTVGGHAAAVAQYTAQHQHPPHQQHPPLLPASARPAYGTPLQQSALPLTPQPIQKTPLATAAPMTPSTTMRTPTPSAAPPRHASMGQTPAIAPAPSAQTQNGQPHGHASQSPMQHSTPQSTRNSTHSTPQPPLTPQQVQAQENEREAELLQSLKKAT